jgi:ERCC4-type nuclease
VALNICVDKQSSPAELRRELKSMIDVTELHLGGTGWLDYLWYDAEGNAITYERKTVSDLSGRVDDLEKQLKNALLKADHVGLIIEGVHEATKDGKLRAFKKVKSIYVPNRIYYRPYAYYAGFLLRLQEAGIPVIYTANARTTAHWLAEAVKLSNRPNSGLFVRYIKRQVHVESQDPQVQALTNLGLGEKTAQVLIERFGSIWKLLNARDETILKVDGVGQKTLLKIKELVGK